jgi:predicted acyltransferase
MAKSGPPLFRDICGFLALQFSHSQWDGLHLYDFVFPLFVFITGAGVAFALPRALSMQSRGEVYLRIIKRSLLMYVLGLIYYGGLGQHWDEIRYVGVLQRIAVCYFVTSILFMNLRPAAQAFVVAAILMTYWALMSFVAAPGMGAGSVEPGANLADWFDRSYLPGRLWYGERDPEGLLSTVPAIATCMLGALAGVLLRSDRAPTRVNLALIVGGALMVAAGWLWGLSYSIIIKALWTSSFVLVTAGASAMLLGAAGQVLDVWRLASASWLVWVGANAITLYMISGLVGFDQLASRLVGGDFGALVDRLTAPGAGAFLTHAVGMTLAIALAGFLYRKRVFVRL